MVFSTYATVRLSEAHQIGLPLRQATIALASPVDGQRRPHLDPDLDTLFITGATHVGSSMLEAVRRLIGDPAVRTSLRAWQLLHQCGTHDPSELQADYGIPVNVMPYLEDM